MGKTNYRIIYYSPHPTHDIVSEVGYATHQRETILALEELGHVVHKIILGGTSKSELKFDSGKAVDASGLKGLIKKFVPRYIWVSLKDIKLQFHDKKAAQLLEKGILEFKPDFIYERSEILQDASVAIIRKHSVPYFLEVNAPFVEEMKSLEGSSFMHLWAKGMEAKKYKLASKIFTVSSALKKYLIKEYKVESNKIVLAPNRINTQKFKAIDSSAKGIRTFGFVGSVLPFHKVDILIEAFAKLIEKEASCKLIIVGDGNQLEELKTRARQLGITKSIDFKGRIPHDKVVDEIEQMDVCVMPGTNWYGSPVKIFEYGYMSKPIIAPKEQPLIDVLEHEKDGLLVKQNADDLCDAMYWMTKNEDKALQMASNFKQKIEDQFTWKHAAKEIINAFEEEQ